MKKAIIVTDLGYGDAGKGSIVDYLTYTTKAHTIVRFNGGAQAAHNVVTSDGRHHTFAQFGSGTLIPKTRTHISRFMMVNPLAMLAEERHLQSLGVKDAFFRMSIERDALITTPFHQAANRLKEIDRGNGRHGSCGMGIGETRADWAAYGNDVLLAGDLLDRTRMIKKLQFIRELKLSQLATLLPSLQSIGSAKNELHILQDKKSAEAIADIYQKFAGMIKIVEADFLGSLIQESGTVIFEGAQGVLLDEFHGFYPHNSRSVLTNENAEILLSENKFDGAVTKLGLTRAYATRHGAGPFVTEDDTLSAKVRDYHNDNNAWQREFRVGHLDLVALRYALAMNGQVDELVVTNLDRMQEIDEWKVCNRYQYTGTSEFVNEFFEVEDDVVHGLKALHDPENLAIHQERTKLLSEMQPIYEDIERDENIYLVMIEEMLGIPITITSSGTTADDKVERKPRKRGTFYY